LKEADRVEVDYVVTYEQRSFPKDMLLVCSIGLNIGFLYGIVFLL
jgi:hypothetical protein